MTRPKGRLICPFCILESARIFKTANSINDVLDKRKSLKNLALPEKELSDKDFRSGRSEHIDTNPTRSICPTVLKTTKPSSNWSASVKAEKDRPDLFDDIALLITIKLLIAYFPAEGC